MSLSFLEGKDKREKLYSCDICGETEWATRAPKCPRGHGKMSEA